jgi:hypothetical protein
LIRKPNAQNFNGNIFVWNKFGHMDTQCRSEINLKNPSFFDQFFSFNKFGHKSMDCRNISKKKSTIRMLSVIPVEDLGIMLIGVKKEEINGTIGLEKGMLCVKIATNMIILQDSGEVRETKVCMQTGEV